MKKLLLVPALALLVLVSPSSAAATEATMSGRVVFPLAGLDLIVVIVGAALLLAVGFLLRKKSR